MEFSERLGAARRLRGLTQQELADQASIHVTQLRRYEAGTAEPGLRALRALATALSISTDDLIFGASSGPASKSLSRAFEAAEQLEPEEQRAVILMIEGLMARAVAADQNEKPRRR